jgi:hypothetical protein
MYAFRFGYNPRMERSDDLDDRQEAVLAADETGMLAEQRLIVHEAIAEELEPPDPSAEEA